MLATPMLLEKKNVLFKNQLMPLHPLKLCNQKYQNDIILTSSMYTHEKHKRLGSIEYIGTQTFDKRLDHYISNRPKRLNS